MANVSSSNGIEKYPKLRFESFLEEWKEISFCDLFTYVSNNTLSRADLNYEIGRYQNIHYGDVLINFGPFLDANTNTLPFINLASEKNFDNMLLQDGDIIIADTAEDETVGKATEIINTSSRKIVSGLHTIACRPKIKMMPTYLGFYLNSEAYHKQLYALMQGIKVLSISKSNIETTIIKYPCIAEQEKVCSLLCLIEKRINKQKQLIEHIKKYKRGVINKLINEISLEGTQCNFAELVTIQRGGSPRPIDDYITDESDGINWIKIGDVGADSLYITKTKERIKSSGAKKSRKVYPDDLILSNSMSFGRPYIMKIDGCIHDGWLLIRDKNEFFDKKFLCYYLASDNVLSQYRRFAAGSCVSNLNSELVGNLQIVLPSMEQQNKCASIFEKIDSCVLNAVKQYEHLCQIKKGLQQQLFI